jgi:hypothetical protein
VYRYAHHGMMKAACDATYEKKIETSVLFCLIFNKKRKKMPRNFVFSFFFCFFAL